MAKVSVVIPAYNCAAFLPGTIESVLAQTWTDWEAIVVDDGSTDETAEVVRPYLDRIRYIRQENKGLPGARNTGIRAASGEFLALLDGDDAWVAEKLERQMPRFADAGVGIVYSDFSVRYADGRFLPSYLADRPLAGDGFVLEQYVRSRFLFPSTMVLRRECVEACGLFDEEMLACEDIELFARICARWKVALVREALMIRYEGVHNITANQAKMSEHTILAFQKVLAKTPDLPPGARAVIHEELGQQYWWNGYAAYQAGAMRKARGSLMQAMRFDWRRARQCLPVLAGTVLPAGVRRAVGRMRGGGGG